MTCVYLLQRSMGSIFSREYLEKSDTVSDGSNGDLDQGNLSVTEIARRIVELDEKESKNVEKMEHDHKREENNMMEEYKKNRDETIKKHADQIKKFRSEIEENKLVLGKKLNDLLGRSVDNTLPSCPVCYETMKPPVQIFSCRNGHLVCSSCKPRVEKCYCQELFMGRAIAMEQMIRKLLDIE